MKDNGRLREAKEGYLRGDKLKTARSQLWALAGFLVGKLFKIK